MVSSAHPLAPQAGLEILETGGHACDAAGAVAAALNVVEPMMSGVGGFGVTLLDDAQKGTIRCRDASGRFPAATDADAVRAPTANYVENRNGPKAVSTPGNANARETLSKEYGKLPWARLLAPAIERADDGFVISALTAKHVQSEALAFPEHAKGIYGKGGKPLQAGDRLIQNDLARTLRLLAADHLSWPTGIAVWKGGVFVAAAPGVWYFKDTDGDRKADVHRKVYTGFRRYNAQAVTNNLVARHGPPTPR